MGMESPHNSTCLGYLLHSKGGVGTGPWPGIHWTYHSRTIWKQSTSQDVGAAYRMRRSCATQKILGKDGCPLQGTVYALHQGPLYGSVPPAERIHESKTQEVLAGEASLAIILHDSPGDPLLPDPTSLGSARLVSGPQTGYTLAREHSKSPIVL